MPLLLSKDELLGAGIAARIITQESLGRDEFDSSVEAFRISVRRALQFLETFESYILEGKVLDSASFQKAARFLAREEEKRVEMGSPLPVFCWSIGNPCLGALGQVTGDRPSSAS